MSAGGVDLETTLGRIGSSSATERKDGLADINHLFKFNKNSHVIDSFKDKTWHRIYETLFQCATLERSAYFKSTQSQRSKSGAATRLAACGKALRTTVEAGAKRLKAKTTKAIIDHIIDVLPTSDGPYCPGLAQDYVKCLHTILSFQPHVEHLRDLWTTVLDFCVEGLSPTQSDHGDEDFSGDEPSATPGASLRTTSISLTRRSRAMTPQARRTKRSPVFRKEADDLVACLHQLVRATNAPVSGDELTVVNAMCTFLQLSDSVRLAYNEAFAIINAILQRTTVASVVLTRTIIVELIPLIKDLWSAKSPSLKNEMMITLVLTREHVSALVSDTTQATFRMELENLLEAIQADYDRRLERDQLQMSDLVLDCSTSAFGKSCLCLPIFALRRGKLRSESTWSLVHVVATYTTALDKQKLALHGVSSALDGGGRTKKLRINNQLCEDLLRQAASSPTPATRIAKLQYLCFMCQLKPMSAGEILNILQTLTPYISDQNTNVGKWVLLCLASLATQSTAQVNELKDSWIGVLSQTSRSLTVDQCSRAASYLLYVLLQVRVLGYEDVASTVSSMMDGLDLQGPTSVNDASLALLGWIMEARAAENPSAANATAETLVQWFFSRWSPGLFEDRDVAFSLSSTLVPHDLIQFLERCQGTRVPRTPASPLLCGSIARAWYVLSVAEDLTAFLLQQHRSNYQNAPVASSKAHTNASTPRSALGVGLHIIDGVDAQLARTLKVWETIDAERPQSLLPPMLETALGLVVVSASITCQADERIKRRIDDLRKKVEALTKAITGTLARADCELEMVDTAMKTIADYLPIMSSELESNTFPDDFTNICVHLTTSLRRRQQGRIATAVNQDDMDVDMAFGTQRSETVESEAMEVGPRDIVSLTTDLVSFRQQVSTQAHLITLLLKSSVEHGEVNRSTLAISITSFLEAMTPTELFACRPVFEDMLQKCNLLTEENLEQLFTLLAEVLEAYHYSRHEVALLFHVDLLKASAPTWTSKEQSTMADLAVQAYEWFVETALPNNLCSSAVQISLVELFFALFKLRGPDFQPYLESTSVRTALFTRLESNDALLVNCLIRGFPEVFNQFTLDTHEEVFEDVHEKLSYSEEWPEGQALRLLLFASLGSTWNTLLRRCIYHIFEAAATVANSVPYAVICVRNMAHRIGLADSKSLFRLFAGQMLYTWLRSEAGTWINIPFGIFDYGSLQELFFDAREEIYAQALMRNDPSELTEIAARIGAGQVELATHSFARCMAYSLSADARLKKPGEKDKSETRLRALLNQNYSHACEMHLAKALGVLLLRTNFENLKKSSANKQGGQSNGSNSTEVEDNEKDKVESMLEKRLSNAKASRDEATFEDQALNSFKAMRSISCSELRLPDPQQPLFASAKFLEVADRLARRAKRSLSTLFDPPTYVFVLRLLVSTLHDALGSLHACLLVRKIRLLVALSGQSVLSGYPLEVTLHTLRPLLTDKQCAEDALGIVQHLYLNGIDYLKQELKFVAGMNLTTLISLRQFIGSSQESTTQESQHRATITKANAFRHWLVKSWSTKFGEGITNSPEVQAYMRMVSYAYVTGERSNARTDTHESDLIKQILDDRRSGRRLLSPATWRLALQILCYDFDQPPSYRDDILGLAQQAKSYALEIWASCKGTDVNNEYLQWAGRVLGRAQNTFELESTTLLQDRAPIDEPRNKTNDEGEVITSLQMIVAPIANLLRTGDRSHAGLAEETLRFMIIRANQDTETMAELQELLPASLIQGLALMTEDVVVPLLPEKGVTLEECLSIVNVPTYDTWLRQLTLALIVLDAGAPVVGCLQRIVTGVANITEDIFAPVLHLVLEQDIASGGGLRHVLSQGFHTWLAEAPSGCTAHLRAILRAILYLREQPYPREATHADRLKWLEVDFNLTAKVAHTCGMPTSALLFAELSTFISPTRSARRSATTIAPLLDEDLMLDIFRDINDPDSFYGVPQPPSLDLVLSRLDHESESFKGLMFRGAQLDSKMRTRSDLSVKDNEGLVKSLVDINMNSVAYSLMSRGKEQSNGSHGVDTVLKTAMGLEQWDVRVPENLSSDISTTYRVFQSLNTATSTTSVRADLDFAFLHTMQAMLRPSIIERSFKSKMNTLGMLSEVDAMITSTSAEQLLDAWDDTQNAASGLISSRVDETKALLSSREIVMSTLSANSPLRDAMHLSLHDTMNMQVQALLSSCNVWKLRNDALNALSTVTTLSHMVPKCAAIGIDISTTAQNAVSDVLWAHNEYSTSIRILQTLTEKRQPKQSKGELQRSSLLAKLGYRVAHARLESPDQIMENYLAVAISELKETNSTSAGQVFHQFATFCYDQLQNPDNAEDLARAKKILKRRQDEIDALNNEISGMKNTAKRSRDQDYNKARRWLRLDKIEVDRLLSIREKLTEQCLENFMLGLIASDDHDNDVLRFYAIWLENANSEPANNVVSRHLDKIASHKFARLMNQLSSRLQANQSVFQQLLSSLVFRICKDHPYHGMHHITAAALHKPGTNDASMKLRYEAALEIANRLKDDKSTTKTWSRMKNCDSLYHDVAKYTDEEVSRQGREIRLDKCPPTKRMMEYIPRFETPPPTLSIALRKDREYSKVPRVIDFLPSMRVAGGLSAPKIISSKLSNGTRFKQLFKGGNDDLRQDAIMEQVFEEVSKLLANHTSTRQRKLRIRTYNVLPLSNHSGIIEFAQNTAALQDILVPLHSKYHPKDLKSSACRTKIGDASKGTTEERIMAYKDVCKQFQPAMRYFFFEEFPNPDEWFERRLAYTRSTAAISILGHVIGLGDRHLHNILLDVTTGEVVHIDLGVCFEAGRVLPIPEVVPFRLTRDLVDGMGYTRTEGVFRRCCEFTLETLREEVESIMTLLNVLRYDPLYSWTVSAAKAKRMQDADDDAAERGMNEAKMVDFSSRRKDDDVGEAGRALGVVEKKLSKTLSKEAMVSELIAQATDERNLALLFCGWSAWV